MEQSLIPTARSSAQRSRIAIVPALMSKFASGQTQGSAERPGLRFGGFRVCGRLNDAATASMRRPGYEVARDAQKNVYHSQVKLLVSPQQILPGIFTLVRNHLP